MRWEKSLDRTMNKGGCGEGGVGGYTDEEENREYNNNASSREETEVEKRMRERMVG